MHLTGVIANALLASPPRPLRKVSGSVGRILARTLLFHTAKEESLTPLQLLDVHHTITCQKHLIFKTEQFLLGIINKLDKIMYKFLYSSTYSSQRRCLL
ncbi:hypothetical protein DV702_07370 [Sporosarcina sp. PTS2304]|nr:hypothetical protein DV702_07370 [Sporosarcina sp. PTS2304]